MTQVPHKHAEVIKAWEDGAQIEQCYRGCGGAEVWEDFSGYWDVDGIYRVKPVRVFPKSSLSSHEQIKSFYNYPDEWHINETVYGTLIGHLQRLSDAAVKQYILDQEAQK